MQIGLEALPQANFKAKPSLLDYAQSSCGLLSLRGLPLEQHPPDQALSKWAKSCALAHASAWLTQIQW
jgi:hypothetical protein